MVQHCTLILKDVRFYKGYSGVIGNSVTIPIKNWIGVYLYYWVDRDASYLAISIIAMNMITPLVPNPISVLVSEYAFYVVCD